MATFDLKYTEFEEDNPAKLTTSKNKISSKNIHFIQKLLQTVAKIIHLRGTLDGHFLVEFNTDFSHENSIIGNLQTLLKNIDFK